MSLEYVVCKSRVSVREVLSKARELRESLSPKVHLTQKVLNAAKRQGRP